MNEHQLQQAVQLVAQTEVPEGTVDLWDRIEASMYSPGDTAEQTRSRGRPMVELAVAGVVILIVLLGLFQVPSVRAAAGEFIQRFGLVLVGEGGPRQERSEPPQATPVVSEQRIEMIPFEEAQKQVPFVIPRPMWVPEYLHLRGAFVGTGPYTGDQTPPISVVLSYGPKESFPELENGGMFLQMVEGQISGGYAVPERAAEEIEAGGQTFTYARGAWRRGGGWNPEVDSALLTWRDEVFTYVINYSGLGLNADDLIRIALSVRVPAD